MFVTQSAYELLSRLSHVMCKIFKKLLGIQQTFLINLNFISSNFGVSVGKVFVSVLLYFRFLSVNYDNFLICSIVSESCKMIEEDLQNYDKDSSFNHSESMSCPGTVQLHISVGVG